MRGEVYRLAAPRGSRGSEQSSEHRAERDDSQAGQRYAVVVQSDHLPLSTWLVAPTSTSARAATFRPEITIRGRSTRILAEQTAAVDPSRLGDRAGFLTLAEMCQVDAALRLVLSL